MSANDEDRLKFALETWRTAVGVQQHFNTIEMQIRNIAVTVLTATIGAAGLVAGQNQETLREALKNKQPIPDLGVWRVFGVVFTSPDVILIGGAIAWFAFYFMDRWWYHRLLQGAVFEAQRIENVIKETKYANLMALSNAIREASGFTLLGAKIRSDRKIDLFYGVVLLVLVLFVCFGF